MACLTGLKCLAFHVWIVTVEATWYESMLVMTCSTTLFRVSRWELLELCKFTTMAVATRFCEVIGERYDSRSMWLLVTV